MSIVSATAGASPRTRRFTISTARRSRRERRAAPRIGCRQSSAGKPEGEGEGREATGLCRRDPHMPQCNPVSWFPVTVPRAPRPLLPLRTHSSHSCNLRYRRRTPQPDLSSAWRRRLLLPDGCANSHETEDGPAIGGRLLAKYGGGVSMARKVPPGRKARPATRPRTAACRHNPAPEAARRSLIVLLRGCGRLTGDR